MAINYMHFTGKKKANKQTKRKRTPRNKRVHKNKYERK